VREYVNAHLLFLYESDGRVWGQWDTPERLLAKYLTAGDKRSPAPPKQQFNEWKSNYRLERVHNKTLAPDSQKVLESFKKLPSGVGGGDGKNICASNDALVGSLFPDEKKKTAKPVRDLTPQQEDWFSEWWAIYWRHVAKALARKAFAKHVRSSDRFHAVMAATRAQTPEMLSRAADKRPHGASWLNAERWDDEAAEVNPKRSEALSSLYAEIERQEQENNAFTKSN
jgi:hypothetical protein